MSKAQFFTDFNKTYGQREFNVNDTLQLISACKAIYWCWGVSKKINIQNKGLLLSVNGNHHKGFVLITLAYNDTYTVRYFNTRYNKTKDTQTDVYFDMLADIIDSTIEKIDTYSF
jgi:hypothetical protein